MRGNAIAEITVSLIIAALTGLYAFGGLALAAYALLAMHPVMRIFGLILLFVGLVNLPICLLWSRQAAGELARWSDDLFPHARKTGASHSGLTQLKTPLA